MFEPIDLQQFGTTIQESIQLGRRDDYSSERPKPEPWLVRHIKSALTTVAPDGIVEEEVWYPNELWQRLEFQGKPLSAYKKGRADLVVRFPEGTAWIEVKYLQPGADSQKKSDLKAQALWLSLMATTGLARQVIAITLFDFYTEGRTNTLVNQLLARQGWVNPCILPIDRESLVTPSLPVWLVLTGVAN